MTLNHFLGDTWFWCNASYLNTWEWLPNFFCLLQNLVFAIVFEWYPMGTWLSLPFHLIMNHLKIFQLWKWIKWNANRILMHVIAHYRFYYPGWVDHSWNRSIARWKYCNRQIGWQKLGQLTLVEVKLLCKGPWNLPFLLSDLKHFWYFCNKD